MPDRYELLPDEDLRPEREVPHVETERQAELMRELRALHNAIPQAQLTRDRQMQAWALSNSLSRHDMARAVGLAKSRVDQIIRDLTLDDEARRGGELFSRLISHMPEDFDWTQLGEDVNVLLRNADYLVLSFRGKLFVNGQQVGDETAAMLADLLHDRTRMEELSAQIFSTLKHYMDSRNRRVHEGLETAGGSD